MTVQELIDRLQSLNSPECEVGWETSTNYLDLLIGDDPETGEMVSIPKPNRM